MSEKIVKQEFRFFAKDESDNDHVLVVYRDYIVVTSSECREEIPGLFSVETMDGTHVNVISKGNYRIVGFPPIDLTSGDPRAPE
jgi:hypothetical protein